MSGGHFNYGQYYLKNMADEIDQLIESNSDESIDSQGYQRGRMYSQKTIEEFIAAYRLLIVAQTYVQRIDWLVSGDDGEETFHKRLKEDLEMLDHIKDTTEKEIEEEYI